MFLKKYQKPYTYTDYFKWHASTLLFFAKMYIKNRTIKYFPWKQYRLTRYKQNVWKINGKEKEYLWVKENLIVP